MFHLLCEGAEQGTDIADIGPRRCRRYDCQGWVVRTEAASCQGWLVRTEAARRRARRPPPSNLAPAPAGLESKFDPTRSVATSGFATQCDRGRTTLLRKGEARRSGRSSRHAVDSLKEAAARRDPADGDKCDFTFAGKLSTPRALRGGRHLKCSEHGPFRNISNVFWNPVRSTQIMRGNTEGRCQPISAFSICSQTRKEIYTVCTCMSTGSVAVATLCNFLSRRSNIHLPTHPTC